MLERVALQQTRFRTPGLGPDARGVAFGDKLAVLFPSLDRLIAFLRGYAARESLDELLATLRIAQVRTPLKTLEVIVTLATDSIDRADRVAGYAKLAGGSIFTGAETHFVRYRDVGSPLGYDARALRGESADFILYDEAFEQSYTLDRQLTLRELVLRLQVEPRVEPKSDRAEKALITAESGVAPAVLRYLFRWRIGGTVALGEWPPASAFDDKPRKLHVFTLDELPARMVGLFSKMAGVTLFRSVLPNIAVERGYAHPIDLESCAKLFAPNALVLFRGGMRAEILEPLPPTVPIASLVSASLDITSEPVAHARPEAQTSIIALPIRLRPTLDLPSRIVATIIDAREQAWLVEILYRLPETVLSKLRIARTETHLYILSDKGIDALPLGMFHRAVIDRVYVPAGFTLEPALDAISLRGLLPSSLQSHVFLGVDGVVQIDDGDFVPLTREALRVLRPVSLATTSIPTTPDTLAKLIYGDVSRSELRDFDEETKESP